METMRGKATLAAAGLTAALLAGGGLTAVAGSSDETATVDYLVLYEEGADAAAAQAAVAALGGEVVAENAEAGYALVRSNDPGFVLAVDAAEVLEGAARNRPIGFAPNEVPKRDPESVDGELATALATATATATAEVGPGEPLASAQWDMAMVNAPAAHAVTTGDRRVRVGIIDTGIDGSHPDIAPNFDAALSRNFTVDIPLIDGPCEEEADQSCNDAADVDEDGHGTHVAGTVAAAANGFGIAGVAPDVTLVNLRAGQDSGYFFLQPTLDALYYAGNNGIDVVNMSFFVDPWLFNCKNNPGDTRAEQLEQRTIWKATQKALDFAWNKGVTLVGALGNEHTNMSNPTVDAISPDFPPGIEKERQISDGDCRSVPSELRHTIAVTSLGPSGKKADYSNWGFNEADVSAPGGWFRDGFGTDSHRTPGNLILSPYPEGVGRATGEIGEDGEPTSPFVVKHCQGETCAYYQYLQGTSMASPHAAGVAALIVSRFGKTSGDGLTMRASKVEKVLFGSAKDTPCPAGPITYLNEGRDESYTANCEGGADFNSVYGHGIVDALAAVNAPKP
jgi:subtilisin family serine protease